MQSLRPTPVIASRGPRSGRRRVRIARRPLTLRSARPAASVRLSAPVRRTAATVDRRRRDVVLEAALAAFALATRGTEPTGRARGPLLLRLIAQMLELAADLVRAQRLGRPMRQRARGVGADALARHVERAALGRRRLGRRVLARAGMSRPAASVGAGAGVAAVAQLAAADRIRPLTLPGRDRRAVRRHVVVADAVGSRRRGRIRLVRVGAIDRRLLAAVRRWCQLRQGLLDAVEEERGFRLGASAWSREGRIDLLMRLRCGRRHGAVRVMPGY